MYWRGAFATAVAWGVLGPSQSSASAFTVVVTRASSGTTTTATTTRLSSSSSGTGWDNENFLEALNQGPDAIEKANEEYRAQSRFGDGPLPSPFGDDNDDIPSEDMKGSVLTDEMKEQIKQANEGDESQGGSMFKEMMAKAKKGPTAPRPSTPPPPPAAAVPPPPPPEPAAAAAPADAAANFDNLTVEQQAQLFRQMMQQQPQAPDPAAPPAEQKSNFQPPGVAPDGRRYGRNRDADAIANAADVYLAQLKRDSTVRNLARYRGDDEKANEVFTDPSIKDIKLQTNPFLEEQLEKERAMLDTSPDEMLIPILDTREERDKSYSGVSYKEKLQQMKSGKRGGAPPAAAAATTPKAAAPPPAVQQQPPPQPQSAAVGESPSTPAPAGSSTKDPEQMRKDLRTTMGLLLKHRGGEGFGSGRLQGPDVERFETLATELLGELKQEAMSNTAAAATSSSTLPSTTTTTTTTVDATKEEETPQVTAPAATQTAGGGDRINSMISCIEGAVAMYKNSPAELQGSVLVTLRAAMESAVNTLNDEPSLGGMEMPSPTAQGTSGGGDSAERVNGVITVVEGAIQMYKSSPPDLQQAVLFTLRASLVTGIGSLNEIMSQQTGQQENGTTENSMESSSPTPRPAQMTEVTPEAPAAPAAADVYSGNDENSAFFEQLYSKLENAKGNGKMGLSTELSSADATDLADDIAKMRSLLVEELETGIPDSSATPDAGSGSQSSSKYQEMLAKARAEKEDKK